MALLGPCVLDTQTATRRVLPTSVIATVCALAVAPAIFAQLSPAALQRSHWYLYGPEEPFQVPLVALSLWLSLVAPAVLGSEMFRGAVSEAIVPNAGKMSDLALVEPWLFLAVTVTRTVWPTLPELRVRVLFDAPAMILHADPALEQRFHWNL